MARLIWSPQAAADLEGICRRIGADSPYYARVFAQDIVSLVEELDAHPRLGRVVPEYGEDSLRGRSIEIAALVHAARDFRKLRLR